MLSLSLKNNLVKYIAKFLLAFLLLYFGTIAWIGLTVPGGFYSSFVENYLNYPAWLRASILAGSTIVLNLFGHQTYQPDAYILRIENGDGIRMVYSCIGYGVMSFWTAFVFANNGSWKRKLKWIFGGLISLWFINIMRVSLLLVINNKHKSMPLGIDHHTWFNIAAYLLIFVMIYFYDRESKRRY